MRRLGYHILFADSPETVESDHPATPGNSNLPHPRERFRALARRNVDTEINGETRKEIERYTIFYGASSGNKAEIFVTCVNNGEMTVWIYQKEMERALASAESFATRLVSRRDNVFNMKLSFGRRGTPLDLETNATAAIVSQGYFSKDKKREFLRAKKVEILSVIALSGLFTLLVTSNNTICHPGMTPFHLSPADFPCSLVGRVWPSLALSIVVLTVTLVISFLTMPVKVIQWDWNQ